VAMNAATHSATRRLGLCLVSLLALWFGVTLPALAGDVPILCDGSIPTWTTRADVAGTASLDGGSAGGGVTPPPVISTHWAPEIQRWSGLIAECAAPYGIRLDLVAAIIHVESRGDPDAISPSGAVGLMQIMPRENGYPSRPTRAALLDPPTNIEWGLRLLQDGLAFFDGNVALALGKYYGGRVNAIARTSGTVGYAALVLRHYEMRVNEPLVNPLRVRWPHQADLDCTRTEGSGSLVPNPDVNPGTERRQEWTSHPR